MRSFIPTINKFPIQLLVLASLLTFQSCGPSSEEVIQIEENSSIESELITISPSQFKVADMKLGSIEEHSFHKSIRTNGVIDVPPQNQASVSVYFGGYVKNLELLPGSKVQKGQYLFTLENPEYIDIQREYLEAKAKIEYLESDYERQKLLASENVSSQKNAIKAESDFKVTETQMESLKQKLELMNIHLPSLNKDNMRSEISVYSPLNGFITEMNITIGAFLNPQDVALSIVDTDHIHAELGVFEKDIPALKEGQTVKFGIQGNTHKVYDASIYLINRYVNPETRSASVHCHLLNEEDNETLFPGMHIEAEIYTNSTNGPALPSDAIIESDGEQFAILLKSTSDGNYEFEKKKVNVGAKSDGQSEILNSTDFKSSDQFLIKGGFNLIGE